MNNSQQAKLRVLHHWACSGGTLISKCIASLPKVIFLNEINPLAHLRLLRNPTSTDYCPTDLGRQLSLSHNGSDPTLAMAAFAGSLSALLSKTSQQACSLLNPARPEPSPATGSCLLLTSSIN